jgi:signal transduction histidine kinase
MTNPPQKRPIASPLSQFFSRLLFLRLFLPLLLILLLAILMASIFAFRTYEAELISYNQSVVYAVETYITAASNVVDALALNANNASPQEISAIFEALCNTYDAFDAFYLLDRNGKVIALAPANINIQQFDMSGLDVYANALKLPDVAISTPFISIRTGEPTVFLAQENDKGEVILTELSLQALDKALTNRHTTLQNTAVFLVDRYGNFLAHPEKEKVSRQDHWDGINLIETKPAQSAVVIYWHDEPDRQSPYKWYDLLVASDIRSVGWYVVSLTPIEHFINPYATLFVVVTIAVIALLMVTLRSLIRRFRWFVADPLKQLSQLTHATARGNYVSQPISQPIRRIQVAFEELETLKADFYNMIQELKLRESKLCEVQEDLRTFNNQLEARVAERTIALETANREMEAFSYSVSHDLRAPIRHINGYTKILKESYARQLDEQGQQLLERVDQASLRMASLIDSLLMLSRISRSEIRRETVDLSHMAREISTELQSSQTERPVTWKIQPDLKAQADKSLMFIVLSNLLSNAWKFTSGHAHTCIEVGSTELEGHITYFVSDDGAGFDMAYANKLFGPFQRLHSEDEFEGTGIGLALVQRIIHRHQGEIWAKSAPEKGATFYFTLGTYHEEDI